LRWIILSVVLALVACWAVQWQRERAWHQITVLPLHGAYTACIRPARGGDEWWINCGDQSAVAFTLKPFWQAKGGNRIDNLLLTHGDTRYVGGAARLHETFPIRNIYASPVASRSSRYRELLSELEGKARLQRTATNGALIQPWQILYPDSSDRFPNAADNSVAAIGQFDGLHVLLLMNLSRAGQNAIFQRHPNLRADVVVTGLPQNDEPLPTEWLEVLRPKWIIVADSDAPSHRASPALLSRLQRSGAETISTRTAGAVTLSIRGKECRIRATRPLTDFEPALEMGGPSARDE
jgi:competence protein ComEC